MSWEVNGRSKSISRSEILRKQEHKVSFRCALPSPLQKRSKNCKELYQSFEHLSFFYFCKKVGVVLVWAGVNFGGDLVIFSMEATTEPEENIGSCGALSPRSFSSNQYSSNFLPKSKKTPKLKTSMQSFVILGSLLQWRWQ